MKASVPPLEGVVAFCCLSVMVISLLRLVERRLQVGGSRDELGRTIPVSRKKSGPPTLMESQRRAQTFEGEIRQRVKRFQPRVFGPILAGAILRVMGDRWLFRRFPPHYIVHSIEANCTYHRPHFDDELTDTKIRRLARVYAEYVDPYVDHALSVEQSLHLGLAAMAQQQFPFQMVPNIKRYARYLRLFVLDNPMSEIDGLVRGSYGLSLRDWMHMTFMVLSYVIGQETQIMTVDTFADSEIDAIPRDAISPFLETLSLTVGAIRNRYLEVREDVAAHLWIFIRSVFFEYPLIDYENGEYLLVHPGMFVPYSCERLFSICADLDEGFLEEFGGIFEGYVGDVLKEMPSTVDVYREDDLEKVSPGKVCDYAVEFNDCILFVECKATRYSSRFLTGRAIANDNSTGKIAEGFEQILAVAQRVRDGNFDSLFEDSSKALVGICVFFGDIWFVNSTYYTGLVVDRMSGETREKGEWWEPLEMIPQGMSIGTFEDFVRILQHTGQSPAEIIREKLAKQYVVAGEWGPFLHSYADDIDEWMLPFLWEGFDSFSDELLAGDRSEQSNE